MVNKDDFQRYLDVGIAFTNLTRSKAEELVSELVQNGEFQTSDARAKVDELLERSRKSREALVAQVRKEVAHQLDAVGVTNLEDLAEQVATLIGRTAAAGRAATTKKSAPTKSAAAKKSPAKKATAKKATAAKATAKKATATKRSPAKKSAAAKKSPAKKATAKKATAKKVTATKTGAPTAGGPTGAPAGTGSAG